MKIPSQENQDKAIRVVAEFFNNSKKLSSDYRERMLDVYDELSTFKQKKVTDWSTEFKVNKAYEVVNKILPRIVAKNPKWIVSLRTDEFSPEDRLLEAGSPEKMKRKEELETMSLAVQDYLTYLFDNYSLGERARLWAKTMLGYGNAYAEVEYKYEVSRTKDSSGKVIETVSGEYPNINVKSWTDVYVDPRYVFLEDMPGYITIVNGVRLGALKKQKRYFNLDKIEDIPDIGEFSKDPESYKMRVFNIAGIQMAKDASPIDKNSLNLKVYCGYFEEEGSGDERMYKITTVDDMFVIGYEEISHFPMEDIKAFEDTETHFATGFVEPILGLQKELNFKKNSASEYINNALNRSWIWSPNSGVDPRDLQSKPGNIIVTSKDAETALANMVELPMRPLTADYFNEQNDFERQIQGATFTVDTSNQQNQQALTNTATGIRVKFFESNSVIDEVRKHFEEGLERLAYKLLQCTFENVEDNIVFKKTGDEEYWEMNKEALRDAVNRYAIKVEVNSSSFDSVENRREDAIAMFNILLQAKQSGVNVDLEAGLKEILGTFEKKVPERFIAPPMIQMPPQMDATGKPIPLPMQPQSTAASLTQEVAQGNITSAM